MRLQPYEVPDGAVIRSELIERLEDVASHRLTLVTAPAGFGKTWLVSEWLAHRMDYERCWVTVDADDNDPVRLLTHLAQSIAGSHPDSSRLLLTQIADSSIGVTIVLETMLSALASTETDFVIVVDDDVAKVSVVGIGMRSHAGVAQRMFKALASENINIKVITTSEIKVSVLIDRKYMELAVQALHDAFGLDQAA